MKERHQGSLGQAPSLPRHHSVHMENKYVKRRVGEWDQESSFNSSAQKQFSSVLLAAPGREG